MSPRPHDLVLIVADTYRKDSARLSPSPEGRRSPFFDGLSPFYSFERCFSSAPWTLPACSSILSGFDSSTHGYFFHDRPLGRPTLGYYLSEEFYRLAIVNNRNLKPFTGFDRDFDAYRYIRGHDEPFEKASQFLTRRNSGRPRFFFFHSNMPHDYYKESSEQYYTDCFPQRDDWFHIGYRVGNWVGLPPEKRERIRSIYDATTSNMEERLAALLRHIDLDRTILCFVADHGEGFDYERGRIHHGGRLHDDLIRVPLLVHLPYGSPRDHHEALAAMQNRAVSTSDIMPTLLELCGRTEMGQIEGQSLLRRVDQEFPRRLSAEDQRYLYRPNRERYNTNFRGKNTSLWRRLKNYLAQKTYLREFNLKAYIRYPYKLIVTSYHVPSFISGAVLSARVGRELFFCRSPLIQIGDIVMSLELFDLDNDPGECKNLLADSSPSRLREQIGDHLGGLSEMFIEVGSTRLTMDRIAASFRAATASIT